MLHMIFVEPNRLELETAPDARLRHAREAVVRPLVMGRCDLDRLYVAGLMPITSGEPIGHEIIGEIVDLGDEAARHFRIGQRVIVPAQISCGECGNCRRGETGRCENVPFGASYGMGREGGYCGGVAELVRVPFARGMLVPLPDDIDLPPLMGLADMASDAWRSVGPALAEQPGADVLVMGGFTPVIGIYAAALASMLGAARVVYVDASENNRKAAALYGVETAEDIDVVNHRGFGIVVDAACNTALFEKALRACAPAAHLTSIAPPLQTPAIPMLETYHKGLTWKIGRPNCRHGHGPVLDAWSSCGFRPQHVGPKLYDFAQAPEAWLDEALYVAVTA